MPAGNDNYLPVAFDAKVRFYLENEKLRFEYIPMYYDFEPDKLTRTLSKDQYPAFVTKEKQKLHFRGKALIREATFDKKSI
jgi:hypothetical protein